jgi:hypothetical protein
MTKKYLLYGLIVSVFALSLPACKTKSGCPTNDYTNRMDSKKQKRGKSNLFDKDRRKRM